MGAFAGTAESTFLPFVQSFIGLEQIFQGSGNPNYPGGQFFNMCNLGSARHLRPPLALPIAHPCAVQGEMLCQ